jgi:transcriptional regulator with XRE-family HTH domain
MTDHQQRLGSRLRAIRRQQGLTLHDVEDRSDGEWKAVVVGSYERGDRAISIAKLARLADFYGAPLRDVLPQPVANEAEPVDPDQLPRICLDLATLAEEAEADVLNALSRYARRIQIERGDYNGRMLTIRRDDLRAIALAFGREPDELVIELDTADALVR